MGMGAYIWAGIAIAIIWGIARIVRWWNLPRVAEARAKRVIEMRRERTKRMLIRRGLHPSEELVNKTIEVEDAKKRKGLLGRIFRRRK